MLLFVCIISWCRSLQESALTFRSKPLLALATLWLSARCERPNEWFTLVAQTTQFSSLVEQRSWMVATLRVYGVLPPFCSLRYAVYYLRAALWSSFKFPVPIVTRCFRSPVLPDWWITYVLDYKTWFEVVIALVWLFVIPFHAISRFWVLYYYR